MDDVSYEEFEEIFQEFYLKYIHLGWFEVWGHIKGAIQLDDDDEDSQEGMIYGNWFDELSETIKETEN